MIDDPEHDDTISQIRERIAILEYTQFVLWKNALLALSASNLKLPEHNFYYLSEADNVIYIGKSAGQFLNCLREYLCTIRVSNSNQLKITGIDPSGINTPYQQMIDNTSLLEIIGDTNVVNNLDIFPNSSLDLVTFFGYTEKLTEINDPEELLSLIAKKLKSGGVLTISPVAMPVPLMDLLRQSQEFLVLIDNPGIFVAQRI